MLSILILAAGKSSRMRGEDKLLQDVAGQPLIRLVTERALSTRVPVTIALPHTPQDRLKALKDLNVSVVQSADSANGMAYSIRAGVAALAPRCTAVLILPADMPEITREDLMDMCSAWSETQSGVILRASTKDGQPGHPVIFPKSCFAQLKALKGDEGARSVIASKSTPVRLVPLPDHNALTDLDTPEAWIRWRASESGV
ncbi:nucleotidyltransferase family protein [Shimia gijangensis]|nr:nucleotidyltransferase family protein [Shimia gijangensis]